MATLEFRTHIGGVSSASLGFIFLNITIRGARYCYRSFTGASEFTTVACCRTTEPIQIPDDPILHNFAGQDVQFNVAGGVMGYPTLTSVIINGIEDGGITSPRQRTEVEFKVFYSSGNTNNPVYSIRAGATVRGIVLTKLVTYSRFSQTSPGSAGLISRG